MTPGTMTPPRRNQLSKHRHNLLTSISEHGNEEVIEQSETPSNLEDQPSSRDQQDSPPPEAFTVRPTRSIPPFLAKHLKLTPQARRNMADYENDRVCALEPQNLRRVLVYDARRVSHNGEDGPRSDLERCSELDWCQKKLAEAARKSTFLSYACGFNSVQILANATAQTTNCASLARP